MHVPAGFATVFPYLVVEDAERYVRFLVQGLNGEEIGRSNRPDGKIANSQVRLGSTNITVKSEVGNRFYDDRQGGIVDPAGNIWWISQRLVDKPYY
jgi:PhnB protein